MMMKKTSKDHEMDHCIFAIGHDCRIWMDSLCGSQVRARLDKFPHDSLLFLSPISCRVMVVWLDLLQVDTGLFSRDRLVESGFIGNGWDIHRTFVLVGGVV